MKRRLHLILTKACLLATLILGSSELNAQILTNGDFESGGSGNGFFVHDYTLINPVNGTSNPGFYARTTNPQLMNSNYIPGGDHTTGTGNMLVFDGSTLANRFFWTTGSTGGAINGFTAGTTYTFSFWIKSVSNEVTADESTRASIGVFFVNASNVNPANLNFLAPLPSEGWVKVEYSFVATANNAMVRLKTNNAGPIGNDFAVDDFSIVEGGLPFVADYAFTNPTCPDSNDGTITVGVTGGTLPYTAYVLSGSASQSNSTGIFTGLDEGTYNVTVSDSDGETFTQTGIVLEAPNQLVVSAPVSICPGEPAQLSATGGIGTYNWTASPADPSLTDPDSATPTVSPAVTTTYTVTSGSVSNPANLIENGDFSQGNTLFTTGYTQVANPNPFGVQSSYDIVTNPNAWFTAFSSCGDNTTGSGNLMVFDGATDPSGNVIVWSNQNPVTVLPNTDYTFSYYVASVSPDSPARLEVTINGVSQGLPVTAPGATCLWTQVSYNWNSGANTTANFVIYDRNINSGGNDFALDDISFKEMITCFYQETVTVTVTPGTVPAFNPVASICAGDALTALPTTSTNGITGTWSPALDNTATTVYTFTPDAGQCASDTTLTIIVNQAVTTPTFAAVAPICSGDALAALPTTSIEGIVGSWSPALNNTSTTTYTFTPSGGQCASPATLTITVNSSVTPTFAPVDPICFGDVLDPLPVSSNEGIAGTWSPALDNTETKTYTFTPAAGQCAMQATMTITVNQPVTPVFAQVDPICSGEAINALPSVSNEGISGTWSPALDNTATTTYTFTPSAGQCATTATMTITVNELPDFTISEGCVGGDYTLTAVQADGSNSLYAWFSPAGTQIGSGDSVVITAPGTYELVTTQGGCSNTEPITVVSASCGGLIQRGISPNNDGKNDFFDLEGYNVAQLEIFNRYGMSVYKKANYQNEWYGQSDKGDDLPDGTYFYVINFDDAQTKTGWIYSIRER
ncbi:gliding motility-associated C-terminal domain-containing protein [Flavobacterium sp. MFBS3-15]|uniref:T9SS type B sorting domain-containing protein n=1 Tax=Flavobacterium sp. MFBS3-15 TaxID=2989816 RepID=UPI0022356BFB|nr:gliding motility-associated C-terminal domain-containing protein [Flavobacterium sp. MFBS3-15]MCW4469777.1 gliding motility-associated C-terminal domain-containing protein [Flavobacterium sp. MFBS3-15]